MGMHREHPFGFTQIPNRVHFAPTVGIKKMASKERLPSATMSSNTLGESFMRTN